MHSKSPLDSGLPNDTLKSPSAVVSPLSTSIEHRRLFNMSPFMPFQSTNSFARQAIEYGYIPMDDEAPYYGSDPIRDTPGPSMGPPRGRSDAPQTPRERPDAPQTPHSNTERSTLSTQTPRQPENTVLPNEVTEFNERYLQDLIRKINLVRLPSDDGNLDPNEEIDNEESVKLLLRGLPSTKAISEKKKQEIDQFAERYNHLLDMPMTDYTDYNPMDAEPKVHCTGRGQVALPRPNIWSAHFDKSGPENYWPSEYLPSSEGPPDALDGQYFSTEASSSSSAHWRESSQNDEEYPDEFLNYDDDTCSIATPAYWHGDSSRFCPLDPSDRLRELHAYEHHEPMRLQAAYIHKALIARYNECDEEMVADVLDLLYPTMAPHVFRCIVDLTMNLETHAVEERIARMMQAREALFTDEDEYAMPYANSSSDSEDDLYVPGRQSQQETIWDFFSGLNVRHQIRPPTLTTSSGKSSRYIIKVGKVKFRTATVQERATDSNASSSTAPEESTIPPSPESQSNRPRRNRNQHDDQSQRQASSRPRRFAHVKGKGKGKERMRGG